MGLPQPTGAFDWTQETWGAALRCSAARAVDHLFTTRQLAVPAAPSLDGGWTQVASAVGARPDALVRMTQVHGAQSVVLPRGCPRPQAPPTGDIIASDDPEVVLAVQVADCVPLLLADPRSGAAAAVHAGWRGTCAGAAPAAVRTLVAAFGVRPADLVAVLGPSIGPCCYEVGGEVEQAFHAAGHGGAALAGWFRQGDGRLRLDLWRATREQLRDAGVAAAHVHAASLCTACHRNLFCSYRAEGRGAGRLLGVIRPGAPRR